MKAQDLRIGNYVHPASGISFPEHADGFVVPVVGKLAYLKIIAISQESVTVECPFGGKVFVKEVTLDEIAPILLTEELLLKCEFVKIQETPDAGHPYRYKKEAPGFDSLILTIPQFEVQIMKEVHGEVQFVYLNCSINTLHKLQNLYFALTGDELNIEL